MMGGKGGGGWRVAPKCDLRFQQNHAGHCRRGAHQLSRLVGWIAPVYGSMSNS